MNERIEQLANEAGMLRDKYGLYWNAHDNPDDGVDLEKFAELIIHECAVMAKGFEFAVQREGLSAAMKQHFGVEE